MMMAMMMMINSVYSVWYTCDMTCLGICYILIFLTMMMNIYTVAVNQ